MQGLGTQPLRWSVAESNQIPLRWIGVGMPRTPCLSQTFLPAVIWRQDEMP